MLTGEALRLGGWVHGAPMIPHVWKRDPAKGILGLGFREYSAKTVRLALEALAAGAGLAAQLRRHRRRARGPVPAVRQRHGRGRRPGARGEVRRRAAPTPNAEVFAPGLQGQGDRRDLHEARRAPAGRGDRVHEGDLPLPGGDLRALPGAHRRVPPARASGCSSRTWRSSTTSSSRNPAPRHSARPRGGRSGTGDDRREQRGHGRHDRPDAVHADPPAVAAGSCGSGSAVSRGTCRSCARHILQFNFIKFVRWTVVRDLDGERLNYPLPVLREQLRRAVAALHRRVRLRDPAWTSASRGGAGPASRHPPPAEPLKAWIARNSMEGGTYYCAHAEASRRGWSSSALAVRERFDALRARRRAARARGVQGRVGAVPRPMRRRISDRGATASAAPTR